MRPPTGTGTGDNAGDASYQARAETYARRLQEAAEAIAATGIHMGLLAQADELNGDSMNGMYAAVPNLGRYVAGWVIHPYHHWRSRMEALLEQLGAHHAPASIPIDVTGSDSRPTTASASAKTRNTAPACPTPKQRRS